MANIYDDIDFDTRPKEEQEKIVIDAFESQYADDEFRALSQKEKNGIYQGFVKSQLDEHLNKYPDDFYTGEKDKPKQPPNKEDDLYVNDGDLISKDDFNALPKEEKESIKQSSEGNTDNLEKIDYDNIDANTLKAEVAKEELETRKTKVMAMPETTPQEKTLKKKAIVALKENEENVDFFDKQMTAFEATAMSIANVPIGIAELSEDIANIFRENDAKGIADFRESWNKEIDARLESLGYEKDDILTPKLGGQIAGEIATVATGVGVAAKMAKPLKVAGTAALEGITAFFGELGTSGDYKNSIQSGALAGGITGIVGKWVEGSELGKATKISIDEKSAEELTKIANVYEFAKNNDIKLVDAMINNNPDEVAKRLKSFGAPDAMVKFADSLRSDTGKKLLDAFNGAFKDVKPENIEDISLKKIAGMIQGESRALKSEMNTVKNAAYNTMKASPLKDKTVNTKEVLDIGLAQLDEFRGDDALINAFKRKVLKNVKTLDTETSAKMKTIQSLEEKIARNEEKLKAWEIDDIPTDALENTIIKDIAELDNLSGQVDMTKLTDVTLEDMVGIVKDMNELKYSGNSHITTKGAKEQLIFNKINDALLKKINDTSPEFGGLAKDASDKARDIFSVFGKAGKGTREFPELEKIRLTNNPDEIAKTIFNSGAAKTGYKIEETLKILGKRSPKLQKAVMGRYIDDAMGGFNRVVKDTKGTLKRNVLDMKESVKAIDNLIGSPDARRMTEKMIGKESVDTLETLNSFVKGHADNLDAMKVPKDKNSDTVLARPVLKQISQAYNYLMYKGKNMIGVSDEFHSEKYRKKVSEYMTQKIKEFEGTAKKKADWNKLGYALSGSAMEKAILREEKDTPKPTNKRDVNRSVKPAYINSSPKKKVDTKRGKPDVVSTSAYTNEGQEVVWSDSMKLKPKEAKQQIVWGNEWKRDKTKKLSSFKSKLEKVESGGSYTAHNKGSGAYGKYQFIPSTLKEYAKKTGQTIEQAKTPRGQDKMFEKFTSDNSNRLRKLGIEPTELNMWVAHNQGMGGAAAILKGKNMTAKLRRNIASNLPKGIDPTIKNYLSHWSKKFNT